MTEAYAPLQRLNFQCWNCNQEYERSMAIQGNPSITVSCPFCGEVGVVELSPYQIKEESIFRGALPDSDEGPSKIVVSDVLPTMPIA